MDLIIIVVLVYFNLRLARQKGHNQLLWGLLTLLGYFLIGGIVGAIYVMATYKGTLEPEALMAYIRALQSDVPKSLLLLMFSIGGALFIRFILERQPDRKPPEE